MKRSKDVDERKSQEKDKKIRKGSSRKKKEERRKKWNAAKRSFNFWF